ncbi:hypothetical protein COCSADRAFT_195142 [Bipolaris sorokiniana ND90Pr]|uniref:CFEM domain-containing protein n=1 Tax=Cochliobolus sativus (strain ND90Pr / ATCC 201652) TaxID=665912 RepID=M2TJD3_COCSN|nr:uncharacterized protein COCSADRAFT_195142 [Bipolaris sorokiniana ND90Pr]EMD69306.1 hypothetical protein COCSADRAFT_195142 [Bipolaris sorokiniana ND90Pr]
MKSFAILAATFAGAAFAQQMPTGDCAMLCVNNMARIAQSEFSCGSDDIACFCSRSNWAFGIRDCSRQACDAEQSASAVQWAYARCSGIAATASEQPAALPILTSAVASATASGGNAASSAASGASSAASSVASGASSAASSAASEITSAASSVASEASGLTSSILSEANSAISSLQSEASEVLSSATEALSSATGAAGSAASSATDAAGSAASSATDAAGSAASTEAQGAAPKATGISIAAGAGIAAWLLL